MPIAKHLRHLYRGPAWRETRARVLARAGGKCEHCGKPNYRQVWVIGDRELLSLKILASIPRHDRNQFWTSVNGDGQKWRSCAGAGVVAKGVRLRGRQWRAARRIRVVLAVCHRNHVAGDDGDENLAAWCQFCHLMYDRMHHRQTRVHRKDRTRPLLVAVDAA